MVDRRECLKSEAGWMTPTDLPQSHPRHLLIVSVARWSLVKDKYYCLVYRDMSIDINLRH